MSWRYHPYQIWVLSYHMQYYADIQYYNHLQYRIKEITKRTLLVFLHLETKQITIVYEKTHWILKHLPPFPSSLWSPCNSHLPHLYDCNNCVVDIVVNNLPHLSIGVAVKVQPLLQANSSKTVINIIICLPPWHYYFIAFFSLVIITSQNWVGSE